MIVPVFGCIFCFIACLTSAVSSAQASPDRTWSWPYLPNGPELPINKTDANNRVPSSNDRGGKKHNLRSLPSVNPVIRIRVFAPNSSEPDPFKPVKVHVVSPEDSMKHRKKSRGPIVPPDDNFISRSSSVMEYDGYPLIKGNLTEPKILQIPNELQATDSQRNNGESVFVPGVSRERKRKNEERRKDKEKKDRGKKRRKNKVKVKATMYEEMQGFNPRRVPPIGISYVSLHSPRRVHVQVWAKGKRNGSVPLQVPKERHCFQCPSNVTYSADKGMSTVILPVPEIAICRKLAVRRGRLNLAVLSGPSPGTVLPEGTYPTHLIGWKPGGPLYSCYYTVYVEVKKCPDLSMKSGLEVACKDGNVLGSTCTFSCTSSDKALNGVNSATCIETENGLGWSSPLPDCDNKLKPEIVSTPKHKKPCKAPAELADGTIACNSQLQDGFYQSNTVCGYFCFPGYELLPDSENSLIVCNKGLWTPKVDVSCKAVHCPRLKSPENGKIKCQSPVKDPSGNGGAPQGTTCSYSCKPGFVVPASQAQLKYVECLAPEWNQTAVPECKQQVPPEPGPGQCEDQTIYIARDSKAILSNPQFFVEDDDGGKRPVRNVSCTHKTGKLVVGKHGNKCTAYDSELDVFGSCTYTIDVKEKSCRSPRNIPKSKLNCRYRKRPVSNGNYLPGTLCEISCEPGHAFSQQLGNKVFSRCLPNLRWNRSWKLTCRKAAACPEMDAIPHGEVKCSAKGNGESLAISSVCSYVCEDEYVMPTSQLSLASRRCLSNGKWNATKTPSCVRRVPPQPELNCSSTHLSIIDQDSLSFDNDSLPLLEFVTADGRRIPSNCTRYPEDSSGLSNLTCRAYDDELRVWGNCSFAVSVTSTSAPDATVPPPITIVADCPDVIVTPGNVSDYTLPDFASLLNGTVQTNCTEVNITLSSAQPIKCEAYDSKTNNSASCSFNITVIDGELRETTSEPPSTWEGIFTFSTTDIPSTTEPTDTSEDSSESPDTTFTMEPSTTLDTTTPSDVYTTSTLEPTTTLSNVLNGTDDAPVAVEPGCVDQITESGFNFNVSYPEFLTVRNTSAEVVCSRVDPDIHEVQTVSCEAIDHETNASSSCEFKVTVADGNIRSHDVMEDIAEALTRDIFSTVSQGQRQCSSLEAPPNGFLNCSSPYECYVGCNDGYKFPSSDTSSLLEEKLSCDRVTGFWNFQKDHDHIPDCLRELATTSVQVWLGFNANIDNCSFDEDPVESKIREKLLEVNKETCLLINCNVSLLLNCSEDDEDSNTIVVVTWNLRASYDPKEYKFNKKVPLAETHLESVLDKTKEAVQSNEEFGNALRSLGLDLIQSSFRRGHMVLVCDEKGFVVEPETDRCVECPVGTIEVGGSCEPCPPEYFQDKSGQTECIPCPTEVDPEDEVTFGC